VSEQSNQNSENGANGADSKAADSGVDSTSASSSEELKTLAEKFKNDFLYLRAEFENYKRNAIKERSDLLKYGSERFVVDVLGVLDNFERALDAKVSPENLANFVKGIEMTHQELKGVLTKFGVTEVPAQGLAFDPMVHEALSSEETDAVKSGHISRVFKKPYKLHDKVVRPAQVIVAKEPVKN